MIGIHRPNIYPSFFLPSLGLEIADLGYGSSFETSNSWNLETIRAERTNYVLGTYMAINILCIYCDLHNFLLDVTHGYHIHKPAIVRLNWN